MSQSESFPSSSRPAERAAASERRSSYPYRFPRDTRALGGAFGVDENRRRLLRLFTWHRRLSQALGAWTLTIPDFEVKIETGRHIFWHMDAARRLRDRLHEMELLLPAIDEHRDADIDLCIDEMLSATDTPELLAGVHRVFGRALAMACRHHADRTCPVADAPTIRVLRQGLLDLEPMLDWADAAVGAYVDGGVEQDRLAGWEWHLSRLLASVGGICGDETRGIRPASLRSEVVPFARGEVPCRDARFQTFTKTGDYNVADGTPRFEPGEYVDARLRFARTQRDEVDAIEAFGTFLWDIRYQDFQAEYDLARVVWDEARHTEIGFKTLSIMGYDPYELPNRLTSSTCRGPMEPAYAMAEINLFGEVGVLKTINSLIDTAKDRGDQLVVHIADYIRADERTHVRKGRHVLRVMTDLKHQDLELRTRELFTECLVNLGAIEPGQLFGGPLDREEIERLVGE